MSESMKPRLVVEVQARFDWPEPPKDIAEQVMREQLDAEVGAIAAQLKQAVNLLVAEFLVKGKS